MTEKKAKAIKKVYKKKVTVEMDEFKLLEAQGRQNVSWNESPMWKYAPHTHVFRTVNADGIQNDRSEFQFGHYHEVEMVDGQPVVGRAFMLDHGKKVYLDDPHTHEWRYVSTEEISANVSKMV